MDIILEATHGLHHNKYFKIMNLKLGQRNLVTKRFGLHPNFRGADEIIDTPISIDFCK